ncbi:MAG TPA: 30S ribosomal protein S2 [Nocardioidaceae bacterium]|nr:30S ribosomal protein S2 [Nocardioidaceae bacterium]
MAVVTMRQLLESGVHFGHQTRRWNPKMKRFIMTERNGIYIIDLQQSLAYIDRGYAFIKGAVASGGNVLFVGTKKQAQEAISEQAKRVGMPFVNQRWLGGMLTNFQTVHQRILRLKELEEVDFDDVAGSSRTKKELLQMRREKDKLDRTLGGIRDMGRVPAAIWIVDTNKEHLAVDEARKLGIPIVAILDSNCDPDMVDFPIPGNDDAIRSVTLLTRIVADAVADGLMARAGVKSGDEATGEELGAEEPLAEWERELLGRQAEEVAAQAAAVSAASAEPSSAEPPPVDPALTSPPVEAATTPPANVAATPPADTTPATSGAAGAPADTAGAGEEPAAPAAAEPATAGGEPVPDDVGAGSPDVVTTGGEPVPPLGGDDSADRA